MSALLEGVLENPWSLPLSGLVLGALMGYAARRGRFCTLGALERWWWANDARGARAWALAALAAMLLAQGFAALGWADLGASFYLAPELPWIGALAGGLAFGFGMALVGTCGFGALTRLGGGSLPALVSLSTMAFVGLVTQRGLLAPVRQALVQETALDLSGLGAASLPALMKGVPGAPLLAVVAAGAPLAFWIFRDASFRKARGLMTAGLVIGLCVAMGWAAATAAARARMDPVQIEAGSFVVPVADLSLWLGLYTGKAPDYGVGLVVGVAMGAFFASWRGREIRWESCDDARELGRHMMGGALMGVGGVSAMGCTIGQGVAAFSALALSAPLAMMGILAGARLGLAWMIEGSVRNAFRRGGDPFL